MKTFNIALIAAFVAVSCTTSPITEEAPAEAANIVDAVVCETIRYSGSKPKVELSVGSEVRLGDAVVSVTHVVVGCNSDNYRAIYQNENTDIAIVQLGDPGECRNATIGEPVRYVGYPATYTDGGWRVSPNGAVDLEVDYGVVAEEDFSTYVLAPSGTRYIEMRGLTKASSTKVRGGYSGGAVLSEVDGRVVGLISASSSDRSTTLFAPIEDVCDIIRQETLDE